MDIRTAKTRSNRGTAAGMGTKLALIPWDGEYGITMTGLKIDIILYSYCGTHFLIRPVSISSTLS